MKRNKAINTDLMEKDLKKGKNISMIPDKSDEKMQVIKMQQSKMPSLPTAEKKELVQAEVEEGLYWAVIGLKDKKNLKMRQIVEWGLKAWVTVENPKEAQRLGIVLERLKAK